MLKSEEEEEMARPKRNNADYFPMFCKDGKSTSYIGMKHGAIGYGIWYRILSVLTTTDYHYLDLSDEVELLHICAKCFATEQQVLEVIESLVRLKEIDVELWQQKKIIWSDKLIESLEPLYKKRSQKFISRNDLFNFSAAEIGVSASETKLTEQKPSENPVSDAKSTQSRVEYSKVKESRVEKSKEKKKRATEKVESKLSPTQKILLKKIGKVQYDLVMLNREDDPLTIPYSEKFQTAFKDWLENKKLIKSHYRNYSAIKKFLAKCEKLNSEDEAIEAIEIAIEAGWKAIFPKKLKTNATRKKSALQLADEERVKQTAIRNQILKEEMGVD